MDGYTRYEIRQRIIAKGGDPDAPPSAFEQFIMKYLMPLGGLLFWAGFIFLVYSSLKAY